MSIEHLKRRLKHQQERVERIVAQWPGAAYAVRGLVNAALDYERERIAETIRESEWKCGNPDCDADKSEVCYPRHDLLALIDPYRSEQ